MRLSDIMSGAELSSYTEVATVIAVATFAAIVWHLLARRNQPQFQEAKSLPLHDGQLEENP